MLIIEGIGDDLLTAFVCLIFLALIFLAWLSTYVYLPNPSFVQHESILSTSLLSNNDSFTEHEFELSTSDSEEFLSDTILHPTSSTATDDEPLLRITIKFLDDTHKSLSVNPNHTISKIKRCEEKRKNNNKSRAQLHFVFLDCILLMNYRIIRSFD